MVPLPLYNKIKNRYCIGYFGNSPEILLDLKVARPIIEKALPGIEIYISCADEKADLLLKETEIILRSELTEKIKEIACFRELTENETIIDLMDESNIAYDPKIFKIKQCGIYKSSSEDN